jgi:hypothetical protein
MNGSDGSRPFVLVDDEIEYWRRRAEPLVAPVTSPVHPVLTSHVELTRAALEARGEPVLVAQPSRFTARVVDVGAELAAIAADGDVARAQALELRLRGGGGPRRQGAWVVGVGGAASLGLVRAVSDGRPFLAVECLGDERLHALGEEARSVHVVAGQVAAEDVVAVQRALDERARQEVLPGVPSCPIGYLHGRDLEMMTFLDAKQRRAAFEPPAPGTDVIVDCTLSRAPGDTAADLAVVPYRAVSRDTIARHGRIRLLAITAHGMSDLIHLNEDYVCGRSRYAGVSGTGSERLPSCMEEGGRCFLKPNGAALRADEIPAEHLFANSCGSLRFREGDFGTQFNIWYAALEGRARSFVGSMRLKDGHGLEGLLYRRLLASGFTLGQAVSLLNRAIASNHIEASGDVYFLLGDPEERLPGTTAPGGGVELRGGHAGVEGGWALLTVRSPELVRALREGQLLVTTRERTPLFNSAVPVRDGSAFHLFLFSYSDAGQEATVDARSFERDCERIRDAHLAIDENLSPALGLHRLYPDRVRQGGRRNLENRLLNVTRLFRDRFTDPGAASRLQAAHLRLLEDLDRTDADIAAWLEQAMRRTRYRLAEHYQDTFMLRNDPVGSRCHICGSDVTHRTMEHVLRPTLRRVERVCRTCGSIEDTPDPSLALSIVMDDLQSRGRRANVALRLANGADREWTGHCAVAVRRSLPLPIEVTEPVRRIVVTPRSTIDVEFDLRFGDAVPIHQYDVQAAFVSATRIFVAKRPFWIVPTRPLY